MQMRPKRCELDLRGTVIHNNYQRLPQASYSIAESVNIRCRIHGKEHSSRRVLF